MFSLLTHLLLLSVCSARQLALLAPRAHPQIMLLYYKPPSSSSSSTTTTVCEIRRLLVCASRRARNFRTPPVRGFFARNDYLGFRRSFSRAAAPELRVGTPQLKSPDGSTMKRAFDARVTRLCNISTPSPHRRIFTSRVSVFLICYYFIHFCSSLSLSLYSWRNPSPAAHQTPPMSLVYRLPFRFFFFCRSASSFSRSRFGWAISR